MQRGGGGNTMSSAANKRMPRRRCVMSDHTADPLSGGRMRMARSRGLASGMLLLILGAWAAIVPFIGDYLNFAYTPASTWTWTAGRGWYEVAPGGPRPRAGRRVGEVQVVADEGHDRCPGSQ